MINYMNVKSLYRNVKRMQIPKEAYIEKS